MPHATHATRAFLLRSVDYAEADRILTFFTLDDGKVSVLARGARRSRRRFSGALEPFALLEVEVGAGRGELGRIAHATVLRGCPGILADLKKMFVAGAALEVVREALPAREVDARAFGLLDGFLAELDAAPGVLDERLLTFELRLLGFLGFAPALGACARCGKEPAADQAALFDPRLGAVVCRACGGGPVRLGAGARRRMRDALTGVPVSGAWEAEEVETVRRAFDRLVEEHLHKQLGGTDRAAGIPEDGAVHRPVSRPRQDP